MSDISLGRRFWQTAQPIQLSELLSSEGEGAVINRNGLTQRAEMKDDSGMVSFIHAGNTEFVRNAINRAELFASTHTLANDGGALERQSAARHADMLGINIDTLVNEIVRRKPHDEHYANDDDYRSFLKTAMTKLLVTKEVTERANMAGPTNLGLLSDDGKLALCNAALGLASMLKDGTISEKAVLFLADDKYYDSSNSADLLRLVADSTKQIKETFIQEDQLEHTTSVCIDLMSRGLPPAMSQENQKIVNNALNELIMAKAELIWARKELVNSLKTDYQLSDPSGKVKSDQEFQRKQLDEMRCILRAFRYDLDKATGDFANESFMTRIRRNLDNKFRGVGEQVHRITTAELENEQQKTRAFNEKLNAFKETLNLAYGLIDQPVPAEIDQLPESTVGDNARNAKDLSHLTNDKIRYFFTGVEQKQVDNAKKLYDSLKSMPRGTKKNATMEVGVGFMTKLDAGFAKIDFGAGAKFKLNAEFKVADGGGQIAVTYSYGGAGYAKGQTHLGADPEANESGFGAGVKGEGEAGVMWKKTKTYANLDEFIRDTGGTSIAFESGIMSFMLSKASSAVKAVGHLGCKFITFLGLRIHKSKLDNVLYNAKLRAHKVFDQLGGIMLKRKNVVLNGIRTAVEVNGNVSGSGSGGFFSSDEQTGKSTAPVGLNGAGNVGVSYEMNVKAKTFQKFAKKLSNLSYEKLGESYSNEFWALRMQDGLHLDEAKGTLEQLNDIVAEHAPGSLEEVNTAMQKLYALYTKLEDSVAGHDQNDRKFWEDFAKLSRVFICGSVLLEKKALELGDEKLAKASADFIGNQLGNPAIQIPADIFEQYFLDTKNFGAPPKLVVKSGIQVGYSVNQPFGDLRPFDPDKLEDSWVGAGKKVANSVQGVVENQTKVMTGLDGKLGINVTYEKPMLPKPDKRPWINDSSMTFDINLTANLGVRAIAEAIAREVASRQGSKDELEKSLIRDEMKEELEAALLLTQSLDMALTSSPALSKGVQELAERSQIVSNIVGGVNKVTQLAGANVEFGNTSDVFKTLRIKLDDWRLASLSLANTSKTSFNVGLYVPVGGHFRFNTEASDVDYSRLHSPSLNTMLGRVADLSGTGNPELLNHFLTRNKKGAIRLLRAAMGGLDLPEDDNDKFRKDCEDIKAKINTLTGELWGIDNENDPDEFRSRSILNKFNIIVSNLDTMKETLMREQNLPEVEKTVRDSDKLRLANDLFSVMVQGYSLLQERETRATV